MRRWTLAGVSAGLALVTAGAVGLYFWNDQREEAHAVAGIQGAMVLYNVQRLRVGNELVVVHHRDDGRYIACGLGFTAVSAPRSTGIETVVAYRMADFCTATDDIIATSDE